MTFDPITYALCGGGGVPVVNISAETFVAASNSDNMTAIVTAEEAAQLDAAKKSGIPPVVNFDVGEGRMSGYPFANYSVDDAFDDGYSATYCLSIPVESMIFDFSLSQNIDYDVGESWWSFTISVK